MKKLSLERKNSAPVGTIGMIKDAQGEHLCHTLELMWDNNKTNFSCIPAGTYLCKKITVEKNNAWSNHEVYCLENVSGRSDILLHTGSWAGDIRQGYNSNTAGCILPCTSLLQNDQNESSQYQWFGKDSIKAYKKLIEYTQWEDMELRIYWKNEP